MTRFYWSILDISFGYCILLLTSNNYLGFLVVLISGLLLQPYVEKEYWFEKPSNKCGE